MCLAVKLKSHDKIWAFKIAVYHERYYPMGATAVLKLCNTVVIQPSLS